MRIDFNVRHCGRVAPWAACVILITTATGWAQDFRLESAGTRFGFPAASGGNRLYQSEAFADFDLPWRWDLGKDWRVESRVDVSAGAMFEDGREGFVGGAGPFLALNHAKFPVSLEGGSGLTGITRYQYGALRAAGSKDFGDPIQFTTYAGIYWDFAAHFRAGYRFQHMSNAGIASPNPGLNMNVFSLSYLF